MTNLRLVDRLEDIPAEAWDALHDGRNPFLCHPFLAGLEAHDCLRPRWGWQPRHVLLIEDGVLVAAAPAYIKHNSHGEFVFDQAWAHAWERAGLDYYPKWLFAVPYTPVNGPRLLARDPQSRQRLAAALPEACRAQGMSSLHVNFIDAGELPDLPGGWLARGDVQFHWRNEAGWKDFEDFLSALDAKKRKNIRQERSQVERAGIRLRRVHGDEASDDDLRAMHGFYCSTFMQKGNHPALTLGFLRHLARAMPRQLLLVLAERDGMTLAGALFLRGADTLYGRYWGADEDIRGLHFECCYYQGIDYCLSEGLTVFEPGAQGEHKIARGFLPQLTHSRHWVANTRFAEALAPWCAEERTATLRYRDQVMQHSPYRHATGPAPTGR